MADVTGFNVPTPQELIDRISDDINARLTGEDARLRRSPWYVLARVLAGASYYMHRHASRIAKMIMPDKAESAALRRWVEIFGVTVPTATKATGDVVFAVQTAQTIPAGTVITDLDGDIVWKVDEDVSATTPQHTFSVTAQDAGSASNASAATRVFFQSPISGISSEGVVDNSTPIAGGSDAPTDDELRELLLAHIRNPPQGGAEADYIEWARAASTDVDKVWVASPTLNEFTVYFAVNWDGSDSSSVIPSGAQVTTVDDYINATDADNHKIRVPVTADVTVSAPTGSAIDIDVTVVGGTDAATTAAIRSELNALFQRQMTALGGTIYNSELRAAIARATETFTLDDVDSDNTGTSNVTTAAGVVAYLGTLTVA